MTTLFNLLITLTKPSGMPLLFSKMSVFYIEAMDLLKIRFTVGYRAPQANTLKRRKWPNGVRNSTVACVRHSAIDRSTLIMIIHTYPSNILSKRRTSSTISDSVNDYSIPTIHHSSLLIVIIHGYHSLK